MQADNRGHNSPPRARENRLHGRRLWFPGRTGGTPATAGVGVNRMSVCGLREPHPAGTLQVGLLALPVRSAFPRMAVACRNEHRSGSQRRDRSGLSPDSLLWPPGHLKGIEVLKPIRGMSGLQSSIPVRGQHNPLTQGPSLQYFSLLKTF